MYIGVNTMDIQLPSRSFDSTSTAIRIFPSAWVLRFTHSTKQYAALTRHSQRFCREAVIWRHLRHPNILPLLGATLDTHETTFSLVSEWMGNGNINEFIRNHGDVNRVQLVSFHACVYMD